MARKSDDRQAPGGAYAGEGRTVTPEAAAGSQPRRDGGRVLRILALIAVAAGLAGLTAAACVLSYSSIHQLAMQAGVHGRLASIYPYIFDAMLVVAGCSVLALRGAGLVSRIYSWLCMLVLLAALAGGGAIRAAAVTVPRKLAGVVAATVPWALVLIGFGLLLALLRYARLRRLGKRNGHGDETGSAMRDPAVARPAAAGPGAPTAIGAPVTEREREREPVPQRALIPGLPQQPAAGAAAVPLTKDEQRPVGDTRAASAKRAADASETADATGTPAAARPAAGPMSGPPAAAPAPGRQAGAEPPTVPGAAVPAQPGSRQETTQAAADRAADQTPQAAGGPSPETTVQARPAVRRAEMQLRARIPRQPGQDGDPSPAATGWPAPFMPRVDQQGGQAQQAGVQRPPEAGSPPPPTGQPGAQETAAGTASDALPKRIPGQQPGIAGGEAAGELPASQGDAESAGSTLSPAPTHPADEDQPLGLPAFRRTRSSPVPPQGDDLPVADPEDDDSQHDADRG